MAILHTTGVVTGTNRAARRKADSVNSAGHRELLTQIAKSDAHSLMGKDVTAGRISGKVETIVRRGDRFRSQGLSAMIWSGADFAVVRDDDSCAHHVNLSEIWA